MGISAPPEWQTDPAKIKQIGIVCEDVLYVVEHRDPRGVPLRVQGMYPLYSNDPAEIAGIALEQHCGAVWLLTPRPLGFDADDPAYVWHELSAGGAIAGAVVQTRGENGKGVGIPLGIYAPHSNDAWGIAGALRGATVWSLAEGVALAAFTLGQQLRFSPSYTGNTMLRGVLADYERRTGKMIPQLSPEWRKQLHELLPSPIQWRREIGEFEPNTVYHSLSNRYEFTNFDVHIYDRNMSYVSSAREVPVGNPVETSEFHEHCPGLYRVDLPHFGQQWLWEPEMRHHVAYGNIIRIHEGFYWPKTQKIDLRAWVDRIWGDPKEDPPLTGRRGAHAVQGIAGRIAEAIIKKVGVSTIGRLIQHTGRAMVSIEQAHAEGLRILSHESDDMGELTGNVEAEMQLGRDDLVWPHVWGTIISSANERVQHVIATYAPHDTILAYIDQIYTLGLHPELDGDPMKTGGWKYAGSFTVPVRDLEELNTLDAQALVKRFARYQREQGMRE